MWSVDDMSDRYAHDWATRSRDTKRSRQHGDEVQCSCCGGYYHWDDIEVHHANYQGAHDRAGVNIFPVCGSKQDPGTCHHWLHNQDNWIKDEWDPVWRNRNTRSVVKRLQRGYATGNPDGNSVLLPDRIPWATLATIGAFALGWLLFSAAFKPTKPQTGTIAPPGKYTAANVRSQPSPTAKKVGQPLGKGTKVSIVGRSGDWLQIDCGGRSASQCWVAKNFVKQ